jgi:predicted double-glycine peptidase
MKHFLIALALTFTCVGIVSLPAQADNRNLIVQTTSSDCGPAALATLLNYYFQIPATEKEMERLAGATPAIGTTLLGLEKAAQAKGCAADSFRMNYATLQEQLRTYAAPVIVNLMNQEPHFAVVLEAGDDYVFLADPAFGNTILRTSDFLLHWAPPVANRAGEESASAGSTPAMPAPEGFVFLAAVPDPEAGRALRREMVARLTRQLKNLQTVAPPVAIFHR